MEKTLQAIRFMSTPFRDGVNPGNQEFNSTVHPESVLLGIVSKCREILDLDICSENNTVDSVMYGPQTSSWIFVCTALDLLITLQSKVAEEEKSQTEEEKSIEILSIQTQVDVQTCVEFVIGFGLLPYLLPDVGIPEKVRKRNRTAFENFLAEDNQLLLLHKFHRLTKVVDGLLQVSSNPSLADLIIPKHAADIVASLLQICKSPIAKPSKKPGALSQTEYDHVIVLRDGFQTRLSSFLTSISKPLLINSLFLIGEKPKFMREACNCVMEELIISSNGLVLIVSTLLGECSVSSVWSLARIVANLMKASLKHIMNEDRYFQTIESFCSQCLQMISITGDVSSQRSERNYENSVDRNVNPVFCFPTCAGKELRRIGLFCSIVLMDIDCQISKLLIWNHLFKDVSCLIQSQDHSDHRSIRVPEQLIRRHEDIITSVDIDRVIAVSDVAEGLLSLVTPMGISIPLHEFQPYWSLLYQVLVSCWKYLERKVQEPDVTQLAVLLKNKLKNVVILVLEVLSSGAGDKLDLSINTPTTNNKTTGSCSHFDVNSSVKNNISQESAKTVCKFCVQLLLNEDAHINIFQLVSVPNGKPVQSVRESETVKIERVSCIRVVDELSSGFESSQSSSKRGYNDDVIDATFEVLADECVIFCSILKDERVAHITSELFLQLLNYGYEDVPKTIENSSGQGEQKVSSTFDSSEESLRERAKRTISNELTQLELTWEENKLNYNSLRKYVTLKLLEELGKDDRALEHCMHTGGYKETLQVVELVIRRITTELKESCNTGESFEFSQTIVFALGFLGTIIETATSKDDCLVVSPEKSTFEVKQNILNSKIDDEFWTELQRFIPHLKIMEDTDDLSLTNFGIPTMARNILISIKSRGRDGTLGMDKAKEVIVSKLEKALDDTANPMLPIKGHGLLTLRKLIEEKDPETLKRDSLILQIFQSELSNQDSYVYLMAIQGLAALGLKFHKCVIPILLQEYGAINPGKAHTESRKLYQMISQNENIERRMKIGEVLVKVVQQLGDIAPLYRVPLTNLLFRIVRDDEPLIRTSALSNLGELCHLLKFSLGVVLTEVWHNVEAILNCEKDIHVRRAALHLLVLLLKGVGNEFGPNHLLTDKQLGGYLRDARRLLTRLEQRESDTIARTHAQLALQELELIVKKLLQPIPDISYKIKVLDLME